MTTTRNNPAVRVTSREVSPIDLAWLAGLWDGDGWIGLVRAKRANSRHLRYTASATLATTSDRLAARVSDILERMGVKFYVVEQPAKIGSDGSWRRHKWNITIRSNSSMEVFLKEVGPMMAEKGFAAGLVLTYVLWRKEQPTRPGGTKKNQPQILGMKERAESVMANLREDRERHNPSTTTRLAPTTG